MKHLFILLIFVLLLSQTCKATLLYDHCNTGDTSHFSITSSTSYAQMFTPDVSYTINEVNIKIFKQAGNTGSLVVSIRDSYVNRPTGSDLISDSIDIGSIIETSAPGNWYTFDFGEGVELIADTMYAIVVSAPDQTGSYIAWRTTGGNPYSGGSSYSGNGESWAYTSTWDMMFECYEVPEPITMTVLSLGSLFMLLCRSKRY